MATFYRPRCHGEHADPAQGVVVQRGRTWFVHQRKSIFQALKPTTNWADQPPHSRRICSQPLDLAGVRVAASLCQRLRERNKADNEPPRV